MFRYRGAETRDLIGSCMCRVVRDENFGKRGQESPEEEIIIYGRKGEAEISM